MQNIQVPGATLDERLSGIKEKLLVEAATYLHQGALIDADICLNMYAKLIERGL